MRTEFLYFSVVMVTLGPRVKLAGPTLVLLVSDLFV